MKIIVFGATGKTGLSFVQQALDAGHEVTAFVRTPDKLTINHKNLAVVQGDALNKEAVVNALPGHDAVVSCLGTSGLKKSTVLEEMTKNIIEGMKQHKIKRIVYMASAGIDNEIPGLSGKFVTFLLRNPLADHRKAVEGIKTANFDWTIARPMGLTEKNLTKNYRKEFHSVPEKSRSISRADVAHFLLEALEDDTYIKKSVGLGD